MASISMSLSSSVADLEAAVNRTAHTPPVATILSSSRTSSNASIQPSPVHNTIEIAPAQFLPSSTDPTTTATTTETPRPWWRPPARNFRPHPGNHAINSYITTTSLAVAGSSAETTEQQQPVYLESLPHYWYRALHYLLRIPFRELLGNVSRPYDPTAPTPLADVPLDATIIDTHTHAVYTNPYTGGRGSSSNSNANSTNTNSNSNNSNDNNSMTPAQSTTRSNHYFQQIRKSWRDRTSSVSWAISTAFFTSVTCTVLAAVAMALNWQVPSVYLKVFLIAFVVRKWIVTLKMMDRALYRLPLNLTEPDPDIDEERHNGVAIYMSQLFTWHGYAMLLCGQLFIFFYASGHYLMDYPIVAGVAIAFSCMGLVPFFALLSLLLFIIMFLYFSYLVMYLILWPFSYWGLVQRRAISRRNGGYQSEGTTNSTDLNQVARSLEDAENGRGGGGGFGATERLKLTPAMMAIPIVIYKKPDARPVMTLPSAAMAAAAHTTTNSGPQQQQQRRPSQTGDNNNGITNTTTTMTRSNEVAGTDGPFNTSPRRNRTNSTHPVGNLPVVLAMPQPHPGNNSISNSIDGDSQNDALNMMSSNLSALCNAPPFPSSRSRSPSSTSSMLSSDMSFIRCASGQQMSEVEARLRPVALKPPSIRIPSPSSATVPSEALYPACLATAIFPDSHRRNYSAGQSSNNTSHSYTQHQEVLSTDEPTATIATPITPAIASLPPPPSIGAPVSTTSKSISSSISFSPSSSRSGSRSGSGAASMADIDEHEPNHSHGREFGQGDEECAICLCDFEDGDVLRHLYCDHMFHKNCVDRWLVKNAFCPKCKRGI